MPTTKPNARRAAHGFTLIELLVVVAVLAILISLLLPAVGKARGAAWKIVGSNNQRQLFQAVRNYATDNEEFFPGVNSSGLLLLSAAPSGVTRDQQLSRSGRPVQSFDWITPALGDEMPEDRDARFYNYLERFADPAMRERSPVFFGSGVDMGASEMASYIAANRLQPARGVSYLMPMLFQAYGRARSTDWATDVPRLQSGIGALARVIRVGQKAWAVTANQAILPSSYVPRFDSVKNAATKIFVADGFRYYDATGVDWDASYSPSIYGSFTGGTPVFGSDVSYGATSPSGGRQIPLSYRHAGLMNTLRWDGHGDTLTRAQSFDPQYWYPSGSQFTGGSGTPAESLRFYEPNDTIN